MDNQEIPIKMNRPLMMSVYGINLSKEHLSLCKKMYRIYNALERGNNARAYFDLWRKHKHIELWNDLPDEEAFLKFETCCSESLVLKRFEKDLFEIFENSGIMNYYEDMFCKNELLIPSFYCFNTGKISPLLIFVPEDKNKIIEDCYGSTSPGDIILGFSPEDMINFIPLKAFRKQASWHNWIEA